MPGVKSCNTLTGSFVCGTRTTSTYTNEISISIFLEIVGPLKNWNKIDIQSYENII